MMFIFCVSPLRNCETAKDRSYFRGKIKVLCSCENSAKGVRNHHIKLFNASLFSHLLAAFSQLSKGCVSPVENTWFFASSQFGHRFLCRRVDDIV